MKERVILPPNYPLYSGPLIFLAGPIKGAPYWQDVAIPLILESDSKIHVASPSRRVNGKYGAENPLKPSHQTDLETWDQVDWETFYLDRAARTGVVMFWCPKEARHDCSRAYAQTTRGELWEHVIEHKYDKRREIVIGIERGYSGETYLRYRLHKHFPEIPILDSLEETCKEAVRLARPKS